MHTWYLSFFLHSHIWNPGNFTFGKCVNLRQTEPKAVIFSFFFWNFFTLSQKFYTHDVTGVPDKYQVWTLVLFQLWLMFLWNSVSIFHLLISPIFSCFFVRPAQLQYKVKGYIEFKNKESATKEKTFMLLFCPKVHEMNETFNPPVITWLVLEIVFINIW